MPDRITHTRFAPQTVEFLKLVHCIVSREPISCPLVLPAGEW